MTIVSIGRELVGKGGNGWEGSHPMSKYYAGTLKEAPNHFFCILLYTKMEDQSRILFGSQVCWLIMCHLASEHDDEWVVMWFDHPDQLRPFLTSCNHLLPARNVPETFEYHLFLSNSLGTLVSRTEASGTNADPTCWLTSPVLSVCTEIAPRLRWTRT